MSTEWLEPVDNFNLEAFLDELWLHGFVLVHKFETNFELTPDNVHGRIYQGPLGDRVLFMEDDRGTTVIIDKPAGPLLRDQ